MKKICPKCRAEYRDGFKECVDCGIDLIDEIEINEPTYKISSEGRSIILFGIKLLFSVFIQLLIVIMVYEFYFVYGMSHGGISGNVIGKIHPLIWLIETIELIISVAIIGWGSSFRVKC